MTEPAEGAAPWAPDLVIVGAARSGTSFLSGTLGRHPRVDVGSVKEPNFFSSRWDRGAEWYDGLFRPREEGLTRVDGSVSYTYPQHVHALERVRDAAPGAQVVYTVREPLARLVSHYHLFRYYHDMQDKWGTLEEGLARSEMFLGSGDYGHWLGRLSELFPVEQVLVVPFPATTKHVGPTADLLLQRLGLPPALDELAAPEFRNEVREFTVPGIRAVQRRLHQGRVYPVLRSAIGPERLRRLRRLVTRPTELPTAAAELAALPSGVRTEVADRAAAATAAVSTYLAEQDRRLGLDWSGLWADHLAGAPAIHP